MTQTDSLEFITNYIETNTKPKEGTVFDLMSQGGHSGFKLVWHYANQMGAQFLINRYKITGQEPEIKRYLNSTVRGPTEEVAEHLKTLMHINLEKPILEELVAKAQTVVSEQEAISSSENNAVQTKVVENRQKNKI